MVKSRQIIPALGAMLRAPWLLFYVFTTVGLLCNLISAGSNKLSDVAGEEGTIDELEALLDNHAGGEAGDGLSHRAATSKDQARLDGSAKIGAFANVIQDEIPSASLKDFPKIQGEKAEKIDFGVGPRDSRYFVQSPSDLRPNNLHTRSGASARVPYLGQGPEQYGGLHGDLSRSDLLRLRSGYAGPYGNSQIADVQFQNPDRRFVGAGPQLEGVDQRYAAAEPQVADAYDQLLGNLPDQYDSAFTDLVANRMAGYYQQADPRSSEFLVRLRDALRSGDRDAAERMLGIHGRQNALGFDDILRYKATSQPEYVYFNHQQRPQNRQVQPLSPDLTTKTSSETKNPETTDSKNEYNPNDPSSTGNSEGKGNHSDPAHAGVQVTGHPQHLSQSQHSASASQALVQETADSGGFSDVYFTAMVAGCTAAAVCFIIGTGVCWYRLNKNQRAAKDTEYPAYGVTGPSRELSPGAGPGGDRTLAHSAHMYHYQQQKNQMIALDKSGGGDGTAAGGAASDVDSEEEDDGEERDYTVYECPGLAPMGEMVVPNPMYPPEDVTPASPSLKEDIPDRADRD